MLSGVLLCKQEIFQSASVENCTSIPLNKLAIWKLLSFHPAKNARMRPCGDQCAGQTIFSEDWAICAVDPNYFLKPGQFPFAQLDTFRPNPGQLSSSEFLQFWPARSVDAEFAEAVGLNDTPVLGPGGPQYQRRLKILRFRDDSYVCDHDRLNQAPERWLIRSADDLQLEVNPKST